MTKFLKRIVGGFLLFFAGAYLLWWSENHIIKTADPACEAKSVVVPVDDISTVDPELHGKLILASGKAMSKEFLKDDIFGVGVSAVRLIRKVEYYQWIENEEKRKTYVYEKQWVSRPVNSSSFNQENQHLNFTLAQIENKDYLATRVAFGGYELPDFLIRKMSGNLPARVRMTDNQIEQWDEALMRSLEAIQVVSDNSFDSTQQDADIVHVKDNMVYFGFNPDAPQIGDVRITFEQIPPAEITIIAQNDDYSFEEYTAKNGASYSCVEMGVVSPDVIFQQKSEPDMVLPWIVRVVSLLAIIGGLSVFFSVFKLLQSPIDIIYCLVQAGTRFSAVMIGVACAFALFGYIWLNYELYLSIGLFVLAAVCVFLFVKRIRTQWLQLDFEYEEY